MKHTYLHDVLPFLRELEREKQKQFEAYFRTAPLWLMDLFQSEIMEAGTTFIRENEPADTIFFVARGRVKATDYRISGSLRIVPIKKPLRNSQRFFCS